MQQPFLTYKKNNDLGLIKSFAEILEQHDIPFKIEDNTPDFDASFSFDALIQEYRLKIRAEDFERADEVLKDLAKDQIYDVPEDYYLYDFREEELMDILVKPDEWGQLDYILAQKLLNDKGIDVDDQFVENLRRKRLEELAKPEVVSKSRIITGYIFAFLTGILSIYMGLGWLSEDGLLFPQEIIIITVLGFTGIMMGLGMAYHKKTLPNGGRVFVYTSESRQQGRQILMLSIVFLLVYIILRVSWIVGGGA